MSITIIKKGEWYIASEGSPSVNVAGYSTFGHAEALKNYLERKEQAENCRHEFRIYQDRRERKCKKCGFIKAE